MLETHAIQIIERLRPNDLVLDIGGWAQPFNRANYVLDAQPYETRGFYRTLGLPDHQGGNLEYFTPDTWIQRDICERQPYPFTDKQFDYVICSHTLEDIRDPIWVCSEIRRIGKSGYIEVPSRVAESCRGWEHPRIAGLSHHRWLIEIRGSHLAFLQKFHTIHSHWRLSLPPSHFRRLREDDRVQWLFWDESFSFEECLIYGHEGQLRELERFVHQIRPYSPLRLRADAVLRYLMDQGGRVARGIIRRTFGAG